MELSSHDELMENHICTVCGKVFTRVKLPYGRKPLACSDKCKKVNIRARAKLRDARLRGAQGEVVHYHLVLERDEWVCGICNKPIDKTLHFNDPMAATVDHVIAIVDGGTHTYNNVQSAHRSCNELKEMQAKVTIRMPLKKTGGRGLTPTVKPYCSLFQSA